MLNKICLQGRMVKDLELKSTNSGKNVTTFTIAVDSYGKKADFIDCIAWNKTAEFICNYFSKGKMIIVDGRLETDTYEDKNGQNRKSVRVNVENANFGGDSNNQSQSKELDIAVKDNGDFEEIVDDEDDLPF